MAKYEIRTANANDSEILIAFYEQAYSNRAEYKFPERWRWAFSDNPFTEAPNKTVYVALHGEQIVGHQASLCVPLKIGDSQELLAWGVDSFVLPEYRGDGLGKQLQRTMRETHKFFASINMSATNMHIKITQLGAQAGPSAKLFMRNISESGQRDRLKQQLGVTFLAFWLSGWLTCRVMGAFQKLGKGPIENSEDIRVDDPVKAEFGHEENELWSICRQQFILAVERDSNYLNWRYREQPWTDYRCIRAYDGSGILQGLCIYRLADETKPTVGVITELYDRSGNAKMLRKLLEAAEKDLTYLGAQQIQIAASDKLSIALLQKKGYLTIEKRPLMINGPDDAVYSLKNGGEALIGKGDQDWDQYPVATFHDYASLFKKTGKRIIDRMVT